MTPIHLKFWQRGGCTGEPKLLLSGILCLGVCGLVRVCAGGSNQLLGTLKSQCRSQHLRHTRITLRTRLVPTDVSEALRDRSACARPRANARQDQAVSTG